MEYVYGVLPAGDGNELLVLPADDAEELAELVGLLRSRTWGELRDKASPARYRELLELCGYGEFAELAAHLPIGSAARAALEMAVADFDPHAVPPADHEPFDAHAVQGAREEGFPPDPHYVQHLHVPADIADRWGQHYQISHDLTCVMLRAEGLTDVVATLEAQGHSCREDPDLIQAALAG